jgi:SAM-dependent methyltransferase
VTVPQEYFNDLYAASPDPWGFSSRWYEERKYALTLAILPNARYRRAFEPGCSIGVLTAGLAQRCDALIASDPSVPALAAARGRVPAHVELILGAVPDHWPDGALDLVVLSEVGYYLGVDDLERLVEKVAVSLDPDGHLVAVHWRPKVDDYPGDGAFVHCRLASEFRGLAHYEDEFVLMDVFGGPEASLIPPR